MKYNFVSLQEKCRERPILFYEVNIIGCSADHFLSDDNIIKGKQHKQQTVLSFYFVIVIIIIFFFLLFWHI